MSIDAKALRTAVLQLSVEFELEAVAVAAIDRQGAVICIVIDEGSASAWRLKACRDLGEALGKCQSQVERIVEAAQHEFVSELIVPETKDPGTSN